MGKLFKTMEEVGKKPSHELLLFASGCLVLAASEVGIYFYKGASLFLGIPPVFLLLFAFLFFTRYGSIKQRRQQSLCDEFVRLFTFFGIYIKDGFNVYNALEAIKAYASDSFNARLDKLLEDISEDKSVTPYVNFANAFGSLQIKEVMISVYQMVDEGNGGPYIEQFKRLFGSLSDQRHRGAFEQRIGKLESLGVLPLIGSGIAIVVLTISIMEIMGGIASVI